MVNLSPTPSPDNTQKVVQGMSDVGQRYSPDRKHHLIRSRVGRTRDGTVPMSTSHHTPFLGKALPAVLGIVSLKILRMMQNRPTEGR